MDKISEVLGSTIKEKVIGKISNQKVGPSKENSSTLLKIISKNFMSISAMARDLNVASQNVKQLVELMGGKSSSKEDKIAGSGLTEDERERKLQVLMDNEKLPQEEIDKIRAEVYDKKEEEKKPSLMKKAFEKFKSTKIGKKTTDKLSELKKSFDPRKILKSLTKYLALGALIGVIFVSFKDSFVEWASQLWETIKEKFDEFVTNIKEWFNEIVQPIIEKVKEIFNSIIETVSGFFKKVGDFIVEYFNLWWSVISAPFRFVKKIIDKALEIINSLVDKLPNWIKEKLGIKKIERPVEESKPDLKKEQSKKLVAEKEKVAKLEKEKQYTGRDEIVRERLGLPSVSAADMPTEPLLVPPPSVTPAPTASKPSVTPAPTPKAAEVPSVTPSVAKAEPSPAIPKPTQAISGMDDVKKMVIKHEGIRNKPYKDSLGLWTIGVGHLIGDGKSLPQEWNRTFTDQEVMNLFEEDFAHHVKIAEQTPGYQKANQGGKGAFIDLAFNMGKWWPKWPTTKKKLQEGDFQAAAQGLQDSKWYEQVKGRAKTIVGLVAQAGNGQGNGSEIMSASSDVSSGQRQQMKPSTPVVVNAPTNNTTVVKKVQVANKTQTSTGASSALARTV